MLHRRQSTPLPAEPTVTHLQVDPSTVCVIDAKSTFDHHVRESTGGYCRRTAPELCVIRRSTQTLRARCRWVPHERMVVDALTKRHGRETHKRNLRPQRKVAHAVEWDDETQWVVLTRLKAYFLSRVPFDEARCSSAFFFGACFVSLSVILI